MNKLFSVANAYAFKYQLDPQLVKAIIMVESSGNPKKARYEPLWKYFLAVDEWAAKQNFSPVTEAILQATSWGPMQVMGSVCRELGFDGFIPDLCTPEVGIEYGCKKLASLFKRFKTTEDVIAAYNAGTPRMVAEGVYENQVYVNKVKANMNVTFLQRESKC